MKFILVL